MAPIHVLVLERDPARREALLAMLRTAGHHAVAVPSGAAAAAALDGPGFEAMLLDLGLPELDPTRLREALAPAEPAAPGPLEDAERRHIALMLRHTGGNKRQAAHLLGISRSTLLHKVRKYGLTVAAIALGWCQWPAPAPATAESGALSVGARDMAGDFVGSPTAHGAETRSRL
jgi:DNA-binding NtrC family response regulator